MRRHQWGHQPRLARRGFASIAAGIVLAAMPISCADRGSDLVIPPASGQGAKPVAALSGSGELMAPNPSAPAVTYNLALAPIGAAMTAALVPSGESTTAQITATGLLPSRGYAVHAHTAACGVSADAAGPHFQHRIDPAATPQSPSSDPRYANPSNEFWLDLRTDAVGAAMSSATVPFVVTDRVPGSIVIHEAMQTPTDAGHAGKAGARVACLTIRLIG